MVSQSKWCHSQCGVTVKVVPQSRRCHVSQSRWLVSWARWCHRDPLCTCGPACVCQKLQKNMQTEADCPTKRMYERLTRGFRRRGGLINFWIVGFRGLPNSLRFIVVLALCELTRFVRRTLYGAQFMQIALPASVSRRVVCALGGFAGHHCAVLPVGAPNALPASVSCHRIMVLNTGK